MFNTAADIEQFAHDRKVYFVSVLTGTDNENDYTYVGIYRSNIR